MIPDTVPAAPSVDGVGTKRAIAEAARRLVSPGQTIVISSGTTTLEFARRLDGIQPLTVITNSLDVANTLIDRQGIELIVMGGAVRPRMHSLLGHLTDLASTELRGDTLFMGVPAVSPDHGLLSDHMPEILTDRALKQMVARVVVLADASKFRHTAPAFMFGLDEVDTIVTDDGLEPAIQLEVTRRRVELIIAHRAPHSAHEVAY
jgi:DeoR/GlpR family transcriptional regulator of sugar metabolism